MGLKLSVSESCIGHGSCYLTAPQLLTDDDDGFVTLRGGSMIVPSDFEDAARAAAQACPERAITLTSTD